MAFCDERLDLAFRDVEVPGQPLQSEELLRRSLLNRLHQISQLVELLADLRRVRYHIHRPYCVCASGQTLRERLAMRRRAFPISGRYGCASRKRYKACIVRPAAIKGESKANRFTRPEDPEPPENPENPVPEDHAP